MSGASNRVILVDLCSHQNVRMPDRASSKVPLLSCEANFVYFRNESLPLFCTERYRARDKLRACREGGPAFDGLRIATVSVHSQANLLCGRSSRRNNCVRHQLNEECARGQHRRGTTTVQRGVERAPHPRGSWRCWCSGERDLCSHLR